MILTLLILIQSAFAQQTCGQLMVEVGDHALLNYLDRGAYVYFHKDIVLPSFNDKINLNKSITIHYHAKNQSVLIKSKNPYKIELVHALEKGYKLILGEAPPLTVEQNIETVGELKKSIGPLLSVCKSRI